MKTKVRRFEQTELGLQLFLNMMHGMKRLLYLVAGNSDVRVVVRLCQ